MKLKEIDIDLMYEGNTQLFQELKLLEGLDCDEDLVQESYQKAWKKERRKFQLMTRCMTSMVERLMQPINSPEYWKVVFECTNKKDLIVEGLSGRSGGVCEIQVLWDIEAFYKMDNLDKKKMTINKILEGIERLSCYISVDLSEIKVACQEVIEANYYNNWVWKKPKRLKDKSVQIRVEHEVEDVKIYMEFLNKQGKLLERKLLVKALPDEWDYHRYLGKLEKIDDYTAALITKDGERLIGICGS